MPGRQCLRVGHSVMFLSATLAVFFLAFIALGTANAGDYVLVTEWGELGGAGIAKIDPATDQIVARLSMPGSPRHIDADTVRRLVYVSQHYGDVVSVIKADSLVAADLVIPGLGLAPIGVTLTTDGLRLLIATRGDDGVASADDRLDVVSLDHSTWPPTTALVTSIPTGLHPIQAFVGHNGQYAVVTVRNQPAILVIDLNTYSVVWQAPSLPPNAEPEGGCLHPTQNIVYVALHGVSTLEILDLDSLKILRHVPITNATGIPSQPSAVRFTPDGLRAYVSGQTCNRILMFDTSDPRNPVQDTSVQLPAGPQPHDILWLPGNRAYVANTNNMQQYGSLSIIDNYTGVPTITGPILTDLAGPLAFEYFESEPQTPDTTFAIESIETWVTAPNGNQVYTRIVQPDESLYPGRRFPALIAIPGGTGSGAPLADNPRYRALAAEGFVVVVFNPEGRGNGLPGNLISEGVEDCNGFVHQDDLKAVADYVAALPNVDAANIGVQTSSFGIAIGAGAVGRYPSLPVAYLLDVEGPHDNRVITFYDAGHESAVCGHLSTVTDPSPGNVAFWEKREAVRYIGGFPGRYLRMQAEDDHAQDSGYFRHAIEMVNAATQPVYGGAGSACWTRMNGSDIGNPPNSVYPYSDPLQYPVWLSGRLSVDHQGLEFTYINEIAALVATTPCTCDCPYQGDLNGDGFVDAGDLAIEIDIVFFGAQEVQDPSCVSTRADFNGDGFSDAVDLSLLIDHVFFGGSPPVDPCVP